MVDNIIIDIGTWYEVEFMYIYIYVRTWSSLPTVSRVWQYQNRIGTYISNIRPKMRCTSEIGTYVRNWDRPRPP